MNTQIYLMLVRKVNPKLPLVAKIPLMLKNFILGDSLDTPFFKFIRVQSISSSIGFAGEKSVTLRHSRSGHAKTYKTETGKEASDYDAEQDTRWGADTGGKWYNVGGRHGWSAEGTTKTERAASVMRSGVVPWASSVTLKNNNFANINLPEHSEFVFTKNIDNATPQLAYGCSAQEPFYFAAFFFRRKIGAGIAGVRLPYMGIGLTQCLINGWSLSDDVETVTLSYKKIMWGTFDQTADINAPTGMSYRVWETDKKTGGETAAGLLIQGLIAGLTLAGTAAGTLAVGGFGSEVSNGP